MNYAKTKFSTRLVAMLLTILMLVMAIPSSILTVMAEEITDIIDNIFSDPIIEAPDEDNNSDDYPIVPMANPGSATPSAAMKNNDFLDALEYTGYKVSTQRNNNTLFVQGYYGSSTPTNILSGIPYAAKSRFDMTATTSAGLPDISYIKSKGMQCGGYVSYVFMNYMPNVKGITYRGLNDYSESLPTHSPAVWWETLDKLVARGEAEKIAIGTPDTSLLGTSGEVTYVDWGKLKIGDIIIFGNSKTLTWSSIVHVGIYAGTCWDGTREAHFMTHVGNSRGPEITQVRYMMQGSGKDPSIPVAIYRLQEENQTGNIAIKKTTTNGGTVKGWQFTVYSNSACTQKVGTYTSSANGTITTDALDTGTYYIKETGYPSGMTEAQKKYWRLDSSTKTVEVKGGQTAEVTFSNPYWGELTIKKTATNGGTVKGWKFMVRDTNDRPYSPNNDSNYYWISGSDGTINGLLPPGTYTVEEVAYPDGMTDAEKAKWVLDSSIKTITVTAGKTSEVTFTNNYIDDGYIKIIKVATNGTVSGWEFTIYSDEACTKVVGKYRSGTDGTITTEKLKGGVYYIKETDYPTGMSDDEKSLWRPQLPSAAKTVTVSGGTAEVTFTNSIFNGVTIIKTSSGGGRVDGWSFGVYRDPSCAPWANIGEILVSGADGTITTTRYLAPGMTCWVKEEGYPADMTEEEKTKWILDDEIKEITIPVDGGIVEVEFKNTYISTGKITIKKTSSNGGRKDGWEFTIYSDAECKTIVGKYISGADGTITTEELDGGVYYVKETGYPADMSDEEKVYWDVTLPSEAKKVTATSGQTAEVSFTNYWRGNITIKKIATGNGRVDGWHFEIRDDDYVYADPTTGKRYFVSDADGIITSGLLPPGLYTIREIDYPDDMSDEEREKWTLDTSVQTIRVTAGQTAEVTFTNDYVSDGYITIIKTTPNGGRKDGWEFTVYSNNLCTQVVGVYRSGPNGSITTDELSAGQYWIKETDYPADMTAEEKQYWDDLPDEPQMVRVYDGETASVTFRNYRYSKIEIVKTTNTGDNLEGWEFTVYSDDECSDVVGTYRSGSNGTITTELLDANRYWIKETDYPVGMSETEKAKWTLDSSVKEIDLQYGITASVTFTNTYTNDGYITIVKTTPNGGTKAGWEFTIYSDVTCTTVVGVYRSNTDGTITSNELDPGTYYVKETDYPTGMTAEEKQYWAALPTTAQSVTVNAGEIATVTFANNRYGKITIVKETPNGGTKEGWEFTIYSDSTCTQIVGVYRSSADGTITTGQLSAGTYYVKETDYPTNMPDEEKQFWADLPTESKTVTVNAGATASVTFSNPRYTQLNIFKAATNGGTVEGWQFKVYTNYNPTTGVLSGQVGGIYVTDARGNIKIDKLTAGTYYIKEVDYPASMSAEDRKYWTLDETVNTVNAEAGVAYAVLYVNNWKGNLKVTKTSSNGGVTVGWQFTIYSDAACTQVVETLTTGTDGTVTSMLLEPGTYYVRETGYPVNMPAAQREFYKMNASIKTVVVEAGKTTSTGVTFDNPYGSKIKLVKTSSYNGTVEGWEITIYKDSECTQVVGVYITDENGTITTEWLEPGTYFAKETDYPSSIPEAQRKYWILDSRVKTVTIVAGTISTVNFANEWWGDTTIIKTATNDGIVEGWEFTIYKDNACTQVVGVYVTNADGVITSQLLPPGMYYVKETGYPEGHSNLFWNDLPTTAKAVIVTAGYTSTVTFENDWYGRIGIRKTTTNGGSVAGWKFTIYTDSTCTTVATFADGTKAQNLVSDADGIIVSERLNPGTYYVKEVGYTNDIDPDYWYLEQANPQSVTVTAGNVGSVTFENQYGGDIKIVKTTTNGGTKAGWIFTIYTNEACTTVATFIDGTKAENLTTLGSGIITTKLLNPGEYWVKEVGSTNAINDSYWYMEQENPQKITVSAGNTNSVNFENKYGGDILIKKTVTNNIGTVNGWKFTIYTNPGCTIVATYIDGTKAENLTSDANGLIVSGLLNPGIYYIKEVGYPDNEPLENYYWNDLLTTPVIVEVEAGSTSSAEFNNDWYGRVSIKKTVENNEVLNDLSGWIFTVYTNETCTTVATDCYGTKVENLVTDASGNIVTERLKPGIYYVKEVGYTGSPEFDYWYCASENPQRVNVTAGLTYEVAFDNALKPGEITVYKTDTTGKALSGVTILLEYSEDNGKTWNPVTYTKSKFVTVGTCTSEGLSNGTLTTGSDGKVTFTGLYPLHDYRLSETATKSGYALLTAPIFIGKLSLDKALIETFTVVNHKLMELPTTGRNEMVALTMMSVTFALIGATLITTGKRRKHQQS